MLQITIIDPKQTLEICTKTVERGEIGTYAVGIRNELEEDEDFRFEVITWQ